MATQVEARIVKTPDVLGGKPRIADRRIGVYFIRERVEGAGIDPHDVADEHDLAVADVYRALAYAHDHPEEMRRVAERRTQAAEAAERRTTIEPPTADQHSREGEDARD